MTVYMYHSVLLQLQAHSNVPLSSTLGAALPRRQWTLPTPSYWALSTISALRFSPYICSNKTLDLPTLFYRRYVISHANYTVYCQFPAIIPGRRIGAITVSGPGTNQTACASCLTIPDIIWYNIIQVIRNDSRGFNNMSYTIHVR